LRPALERREISRDSISCDWLVVEDIQHLNAAAGGAVAHILDRRLSRRRPTLVTAVRGPSELELSPRLASRLTGGLVVGIQPLAQSSRRSLAADLCRQRNLRAEDAVIDWLARDPGGARPILGSIARLEALARTHPPPLTLALVTSELPPTADESSPLDRLVSVVAGRFQIDARSLLGPSRLKNIAWPRQLAMYVARQAGYSFPQIGAYFGGRDHTTVMHSCEKVARLLINDTALAQEIRDLQTAIGQP
jgi:chromosomal replication initiator protein